MRLRRFHRSLWLFLLAMGLLPLGGCFQLTYPSVSYIPAPRLFESDDDVHVFRVDICHEYTGEMAHRDETDTLMELSVTGQWLPQMQVTVNSVRMVTGNPVSSVGAGSWSQMVVRLYRPGYKLVELESWDLLPTVVWEKASTLEDEEKALDQLASEGCMAPGSTSTPHRNALLGIAREYTRRSSKKTTDPHEREIEERMLAKAQKLRQLANQ